MISVYNKLSLHGSLFTDVQCRELEVEEGDSSGDAYEELQLTENLQEESIWLQLENLVEEIEESDLMGKLEMRIKVQCCSHWS